MGTNLLKFAVLLLCFSSVAQTGKDYPKHALKIFSENDFWMFGNSTDIYYTQGLRIQYLEELDTNCKFTNYWPFLFKNADVQNLVGYSIGQNIYTSTDITISELMPDDRPYAAWLYFAFTSTSNSLAKKHRLTTDVHLGVIGPLAQGKFVQSNFHKLIGSPDPKGWPHQVANDIGFNLNVKYEPWGFSPISNDSIIGFDFVPNAEVMAGSVFNVLGAGATVKVNILNAGPYFGNAFNAVGGIPKKKGKSAAAGKPKFFESFRDAGISLFGRPSGKAVLYNALLQGGIFNDNSPYTIRNSDVERFYFDMDYGITVSSPYIDISYSRAYRTREFKQQEHNHQWGQIYLTVKF